MMSKRFLFLSRALLFLVIFLAGCSLGPRSETIVIPSNDETHTDDQRYRPFQVNTIYRLPDNFGKMDQLLGWSGTNSVVGLFRKASTTEGMIRNLERITLPYDRPEMLKKVGVNTAFLKLSPDGKKITEMDMSAAGVSLKLLSLVDGKETEVARFHSGQQLFLQDVSWSGNSKYICYLVIDPVRGGQASVGVYDPDAGTSKTYQIKGLDRKMTLTGVNLSDDGRNVLLTMFQMGQFGRSNSIVMGTINDSEITVQYEHQTGREQNVWLTNDRFVFLGTDGTLYDYDCRTNELAILLEKVSSFDFSRDRKYIAYSLHDKDTILAGKIQGKNVLYEELVYSGVIPSKIFWSPDNNSLLIHGRKLYSPVQGASVETNIVEEQPFIITFQ